LGPHCIIRLHFYHGILTDNIKACLCKGSIKYQINNLLLTSVLPPMQLQRIAHVLACVVQVQMCSSFWHPVKPW